MGDEIEIRIKSLIFTTMFIITTAFFGVIALIYWRFL